MRSERIHIRRRSARHTISRLFTVSFALFEVSNPVVFPAGLCVVAVIMLQVCWTVICWNGLHHWRLYVSFFLSRYLLTYGAPSLAAKSGGVTGRDAA